MTNQEASALVQFIKDHDTRYEASVMDENDGCYVLLTQPEDGTRLDPIRTITDYGEQHIASPDATPTIREAWDQWIAER